MLLKINQHYITLQTCAITAVFSFFEIYVSLKLCGRQLQYLAAEQIKEF